MKALAVTDNEERVPFIPIETRKQQAEKSARRRLGMDKVMFETIWLPRHIWTAEMGFVEMRG
jgi:hypothetical protein